MSEFSPNWCAYWMTPGAVMILVEQHQREAENIVAREAKKRGLTSTFFERQLNKGLPYLDRQGAALKLGYLRIVTDSKNLWYAGKANNAQLRELRNLAIEHGLELVDENDAQLRGESESADLMVQRLLEMPDISLQGRQVMAGDAPLKSLPGVAVSENIVVIRQPNEGGWVAQGWTLVYFMDSAASANAMKTGAIPYLMIPRGSFHGGGSPITDVWKKKFNQVGHEHILGLLEANSMPDSIYVDMMSVRAKYQRNSINTKMIDALRELFPQAKLEFSDPTDKGRSFIKSYAHESVDQLLEAPVGDFELLGDWSKGKSFRHAVDRKLLTHPVTAKKMRAKFATNLDTVFDLYFVNQTNLNRSKYNLSTGMPTSKDWTEKGKVDPSTLWRDPPEGLGLSPDQVKTDVDNITVVFVSNTAVPHEPMTPWIIAHRIGHAMRKEHYYREYREYIEKTLKEIAGEKPDSPYRNYTGYSSRTDTWEPKAKNLAQQLGTFRSARDRNLRDQYEFAHELFAQYLMTGRITLNRLGSKGVLSGHAWGRPQYRRGAEDADDQIEEFEARLNSYCEAIVGSSIGGVYVM